MASLTNDHKLSGLNQLEFILPQSWRPDTRDQRGAGLRSLQRLQDKALPFPASGAPGVPGLVAPSLPSVPPSSHGSSSVSFLICLIRSRSIGLGATLTGDDLTLRYLTTSTEMFSPDTALFTCSGGTQLLGPQVSPLFVYKITLILGDHRSPV